MTRCCLLILAWIVLLGVAGWLRFHHLDHRPIHADEATGARLLALRMEGNEYHFDPKHFHGPWQSVVSSFIAQSRGETTWEELSVTTLRIGPALAGTLLIFTPLLWWRLTGPLPALAAGALLATSPHLVYYSRMFIHESWLALFGLLALNGFYRFLNRPNTANGVFTGLCLGLMFATKETVVISGLSWLAASGVVFATARLGPAGKEEFPALKTYLKPASLLFCTGLITSIFAYTNGLRDPQGFVDALRTFFVYKTGPGQDKPFLYYAYFLLWPKPALGLWWSEGMVALLALISCWFAWINRKRIALHGFILLGALTHLLIYGLIAYKTPWLMLLPWAHVCLLAGLLFSDIDKRSPALRIGLSLLLAAVLAYQFTQSLQATGRFANDARNPYAYVPTTRDPDKIGVWLKKLEAMRGEGSLDPIAVTGCEYWPLPWYLRGFDVIGYWPEVEPDFVNFPVILSMPAQVPKCDELLVDTHVRLPRSLRHNVHVVLFLRKDLWDQWIESSSQ